MERIVLAGFMGSGKTTVGRALGARLCWTFVDLDTAVEGLAACSVPEIFAAKGEEHFRALELEALSSLLNRRHLVIALGGGATGTQAVREALAANAGTAVVHLDAPFRTLYERCAVQALDPLATARPLLGQREAAEARFGQRRPVYASVAHLTVDVATRPPEQIAEIIETALFATIIPAKAHLR